jgi:putative NADH-flavin reductase
MHLAIFGATVNTGQKLVAQALAAGHTVTPYVRDPARLPQRHDHLSVVTGELTDMAAIERAVAGADAVLSVLGPKGNTQGQPVTRGTQNILIAMQKLGVRRIVVSATTSASDPQDAPDLRFRLAVGLIKRITPGAYADIVGTAEAIRASDRDWTIVRVPLLNNGPQTGQVRAGQVDRALGMQLSRADFAAFMLAQAQATTYVRQAPAISNP